MIVPDYLKRAALIGAASGMRTSAPLVAVSGSRRPREWYALLGECAVDKLPFVPSRLQAGGLIGRFGVSAYAAYRDAGRGRGLAAALVAGGAALIGAKIAHDLRAELVRRLGCADTMIAAIEDAVALACVVRLRSTHGGGDA